MWWRNGLGHRERHLLEIKPKYLTSSNWIQRCHENVGFWTWYLLGDSWISSMSGERHLFVIVESKFTIYFPLVITNLSVKWVITKFFRVFAWFYVKIYSRDFELQENKAQLFAGPADIWAFHLAILWLLFPYVRNYFLLIKWNLIQDFHYWYNDAVIVQVLCFTSSCK